MLILNGGDSHRLAHPLFEAHALLSPTLARALWWTTMIRRSHSDDAAVWIAFCNKSVGVFLLLHKHNTEKEAISNLQQNLLNN